MVEMRPVERRGGRHQFAVRHAVFELRMPQKVVLGSI